MFALTPRELRRTTLDCAAVPASFNAEPTAAGHRSVSCDPPYRLTAEAFRNQVEGIPAPSWLTLGQPETASFGATSAPLSTWARFRPAITGRFFADLPSGSPEGSYRTDELPHLTF